MQALGLAGVAFVVPMPVPTLPMPLRVTAVDRVRRTVTLAPIRASTLGELLVKVYDASAVSALQNLPSLDYPQPKRTPVTHLIEFPI